MKEVEEETCIIFDEPDQYRLSSEKGLLIKGTKNKGRGVFAGRSFLKDEIVEVVPVIVVPDSDINEHDLLDSYIFSWKDEECAIALGYGSIYNHDNNPNLKCEKMFSKHLMLFRAIRNINQGEELTHCYCSGKYEIEFCGNGRYNLGKKLI